jgi:hypothetical protein
MRARLRGVHSPDVDDLAAYRPSSDGFAVLMQLLVGPDDGSGEESFDVLVCSPRWLQQQPAPVIGRHHLVVSHFDLGAIEEFLRRQVESCAGETWSEVASKVGRIGRWEFEDYTP